MLEVEIHDKKHIIDSLKRALQESQDHEKKALNDLEKEWEEKLQKQKVHYEAGVERHLRLVDRLLNDKTELTKRCELFAEELKAVEKKFQMKMEEMDDHAAKELAKNKQTWIATERMKRESWEKEKVKEIKEMTIKGLQPEVERILSEKKQEKARMEEQQREALDEQRRELLDMAQQQIRDVREEKNREMETALDKEREAHRQKLKEDFERFNRELQEERAKCAADVLAERRLREELLRQNTEVSEAQLREALQKERSTGQAKLQEAEGKLQVAKERHAQELAEQKELDIEVGCRLRQELSAERDRQLEVLMERLSREHVERQVAAEAANHAKLQEARAAAGEEAARLAKHLEECQAQVARLKAEKQQHEEIDLQAADAARLAELQRKGSDLEKERFELLAAAQKVKDLEEESKRREEQIIGDLEAKVKKTLQAKE
eukprot:g13090.t1